MTTISTTVPHVTLQVATDDPLRSVAKKACAIWSDVLSGHVTLVPWERGRVVNVTVKFDYDVRNPEHPDRVAYCHQHKTPNLWTIYLERQLKWAITPWQRFWGNGEDALAAVVHEMGHIFDLPHASDPSWVMHPGIGGNGKLSAKEKESYRQFFLTKVDV